MATQSRTVPKVAAKLVSEFGARLKIERERLGLTQAAFAAGCGIGKRTYIRLEHGERVPDLAVLVATAGVGANLAFLVTGSRGASDDLAWAEGFDQFAQGTIVLECLGDIDIDGLLEDLRGIASEGEFEAAHEMAVQALIARCPRLSRVAKRVVAAEGELLDRIGGEIAAVACERGGTLSVAQTVRVMAFLYKLFSTSGVVDRGAVIETVRLARG